LREHHKGSTGISSLQRLGDPAVPEEVSGSVDDERLAMLVKNLLFQNGDSGRVAINVRPGWGIASEYANSGAGGQFLVSFPDSRKKVRINRRVPNSIGLRCGLPNLLKLRARHVFAVDVTVKSCLLRRARELHHDNTDLFGEFRITNQADSEVGIKLSPVVIA